METRKIAWAGVVSVGILVLCTGGNPVKASIITLDFETAATGGDLLTTPLVTSDGTITVANGTFSGIGAATTALGSTNSIFTVISFDFDVISVKFDYSGQGVGVFTGEVLDIGGIVLDTFFDPSTSGSGIEGTFTLTGAGIRSFRFADEPGGGSLAYVDDGVITAAPIPEPTTLALFAFGLAGLGLMARRRRTRVDKTKHAS